MLQLVLGISGTGKSSYLLREIRRRAMQGQRSILVVPEQFTSSTEGRIYNVLGDELSGYVTSYSFSSMAEAILQQYGGAAVQTLTDAGRAVLVRRALQAMGPNLVYYRRHRRSTAFCERCAETLDELKSAGLQPETLEELAKGAGHSQQKLSELAAIFAAYQALLEQTAMDPGDRVLLAAKQVQPDFFEGQAVFIDEFDTFNASKRALLIKMMKQASSVTVALCADDLNDRDNGLGLFSGAKQMAQTLRNLARKHEVKVAAPVVLEQDWRHDTAPDLVRLNHLLAGQLVETAPVQPGVITLLETESRAQEAKEVAAAVLALARKGVPYREMAVICRDSEQYLSAIRYEFRLAGIPLFFDEATTPEHTAPVRLVQSLLALLRRGLATDPILGVAKSGLTTLSQDQVSALENYAYTWQLTAGQWRQPLSNSPRGFGLAQSREAMSDEDREQLELAEQARSWLVPLLDEFASNYRNATATQLCKGIYQLMEQLGAEQRVQELAIQMRQSEGIPAQEETVRMWNVTSGLLDQLAALAQEEVLSAGEALELFQLLVRSTDLGHIPQTLDAVIFTTAGRMRLDNPQWCFVLGLAEGEFPKAPSDQGLLTHTERDILIRQGVEMPDCFENRMIREQVCFYKALTASSKGIWMSWTSGGAALPMTSALAPVVRQLQPTRPQLEQADKAATPAMALDFMGQTWDAQSGKTAALYELLEKNQPETLRPVQRAAEQPVFVVENRVAMRKLLGDNLWLSPSRMERYYSCPFSYFMEYVMGARARRQASLSADQSGNLMHYILEQALKRTGDSFVNLTHEELEELAKQITHEYVEKAMPGQNNRFWYLITRLEKSAVSLLEYMQGEQRQGRFVPVAFELGIGSGAEQVPPVVLKTPEGQTVRMVGKIDRVDAFSDGESNWLRVVDYKTGSKEFLLEDVEQGLNCQMLLYLFTLTRNGSAQFGNTKPAGVVYLLADPAPVRTSRNKAAEGLVYKVEGIVASENRVIDAMDSERKGLYVPFQFDKDGSPKESRALASLQQLEQLQATLDNLVLEMAKNLYDGNIAAHPTPRGKRKETSCQYCDYRSVCGYQETK
ncbi:MAG: PD-(D/E)XK nuclease family protein [Candidatus Fournierella pullistercoris]|uniref:PD-(D/E)XK nuclease family protein n=1 Tax=Candidatus Allofournierella pullistercoris TaxID=2838597 RepID=A0A948T0X0_9FIRM|nr:PD-(D/E)XK nuclease family protein [Candidatus Fournierella pullistercoris]